MVASTTGVGIGAAVPAPNSGVILVLIGLVGAWVPGWKTADPNRVTTDELLMVHAQRRVPE